MDKLAMIDGEAARYNTLQAKASAAKLALKGTSTLDLGRSAIEDRVWFCDKTWRGGFDDLSSVSTLVYLPAR